MDSENDIHLLKAATPFQRLLFQNGIPAPPESFVISQNINAGADYSVAQSFFNCQLWSSSIDPGPFKGDQPVKTYSHFNSIAGHCS
jgi:hypothetical protein